MGFLVALALIGWIPVCIGLFMVLPPRRAVIAAFLIAWLFLPIAGFQIGGLPDYTKMSATCVGILLGAALFDADRLLSFRFRWFDLPMAIFCFSPFVSSLLNDYGIYDGASMVVRQVITWGLPYLIGRAYFTDLEGVRELAMGIVIGGLIYVPLCWIEIQLSPQLHRWIYGYHQHSFAQTLRFGGYRPMVFMQHGLMVAMWMALTGMVGVWMWRSGSLKNLFGIPPWLLIPPLALTALLCKSSYAVLLLFAGLVGLFASINLRTRFFVILLMLAAPVFMFIRAAGISDGSALVEFATNNFGPERAQSLSVRVNNENALSARALEHPFFGWGTWGQARIYDEQGKDKSVTDSLWIITLGNAGIIGLFALTTMLLLPMLMVMRDYRVDQWVHPMVAPVVALSLLLVLYMLDHLMNGMVNPIFMLAAGGVSSAHQWAVEQKRQVARRTGTQQASSIQMPSRLMPRPH